VRAPVRLIPSIAAPAVVDAVGGWVRHIAGLAGAWVPVAP
jgi:hypothetical protein